MGDLDGDGAYETDTGTGRTAARSFTEPGTYAVLVREVLYRPFGNRKQLAGKLQERYGNIIRNANIKVEQ